MSVEPGVVDANVLVYAVNADAPQHSVSRAFLENASDPANALYVTSQILCEFYSVVTNPPSRFSSSFSGRRLAYNFCVAGASRRISVACSD